MGRIHRIVCEKTGGTKEKQGKEIRHESVGVEFVTHCQRRVCLLRQMGLGGSLFLKSLTASWIREPVVWGKGSRQPLSGALRKVAQQTPIRSRASMHVRQLPVVRAETLFKYSCHFKTKHKEMASNNLWPWQQRLKIKAAAMTDTCKAFSCYSNILFQWIRSMLGYASANLSCNSEKREEPDMFLFLSTDCLLTAEVKLPEGRVLASWWD